MLSSTAPDSEVRARFTVKDVFQLPEGETEYRVEYGPGSKQKFEELHKALLAQGLTPRLIGGRDNCVLVLRKASTLEVTRSRVPVMLALATLASVVFFSLFERLTYEQFAPAVAGYQVLGLYIGGVVGILGAHELGRRYVAKRSKSFSPGSYALPGIPYLTTILPSLGFVSAQRKPAINRDKLFDIMLAGPLVALAVSVILYTMGGFMSTQSSHPLPSCESNSTYISVCSSVVQSALDAVTNPFLPAIAPGYLRFSPIQDAAAIGFLLTFINLLPMANFDGGFLSALTWGRRAARVATYLSALALITIDAPFYWGAGVFVLLLAARPLELQLLDEVSGATRSRRLLYLGALVIGFLCLPIPQNLATFALG
ncbi:MAG: hypothetical protein OK404_03150 [Thaumarchaeota archaeon]|nr:hypothetical protein [Nitrososphaerota archaeon]